MMQYTITEQNGRTCKTRDIATIEAKTAGDALNSGNLDLPTWTEGCAIDSLDDGSAMIEHPTDKERLISADPVDET